jgi:hypothetical protein
MAEQLNNNNSEVIAEAEISAWRDLKAGRLEVLHSSIRIFSKKSLFKKPVLKADFGTGEIDIFRLEGDLKTNLVLEFLSSTGEKSTETIGLLDPTEADTTVSALRNLLGPLNEVSRSESLQLERERLLKEQEEKKKALIQAYSILVWSNIEGLRTIVQGIYQIVVALKIGNWNLIKEQYETVWQQTDRLQQSTGFKLLPALEDIGTACSDRNGPGAVISSAKFLETMEKAYATNPPPKHDWNEEEMQNNISPNWYHLLYFHFFYRLCRETVLDCEFGDWVSVESSLSKLGIMSQLMKTVFGLDVTIYTAQISNLARKKDLPELKKSLINLDEYLKESSIQHFHSEVN